MPFWTFLIEIQSRTYELLKNHVLSNYPPATAPVFWLICWRKSNQLHFLKLAEDNGNQMKN